MNFTLYLIILIQLVIVSMVDLKTHKISNLWVMGNILAACILFFFFPDILTFSLEHLYIPLGFIVIGFVLFLLNIMGAGDSKYLASLFLLTSQTQQFELLQTLLVVTMVMGGLLLLVKVLKHWKTLKAYFVSGFFSGMKAIIRSKFSYAPAICLAWILWGVTLWR